MSGIFGVIDEKGIDIKRLVLSNNSLTHRGPDDEGYVLLNDVPKSYAGSSTEINLKLPQISSSIRKSYQMALAHRRLATIDLSPAGHQPMGYSNGNLWITFDGAIFNYIELRNELITKGYRFSSDSDTEVILAAYSEWGTDCVKKFNGMWAFGIWDHRERVLFLSRDRFAEKTLYYYHQKNCFIFASEIKAIRTYLENELSIAEGVNRYSDSLEYQVGQTNKTMFNNVVQLMHGNSLLFKNGGLKFDRYYYLEFKKGSRSLEENVEVFNALFEDSLRLRLRSDVEVGAFLSGGQDSSAIVSVAYQKINRRITTISSVFPGFKSDESEYIDSVIKKHDCRAIKFVPDISDLFAITDKQIYHQEAPIDQINSLTQWFAMEKASSTGLKVMLDGQGSDEQLAGYPWLLLTYFREMLFRFRFIEIYNNKDIFLRWNYTPINILRSLKHYFSSKIVKTKQHMFADLNKNLMYLFNCANIPYFFHFGDRAAMAHSVEDRCPFVDFRLVEFLFSLPSNQKIRNSKNKFILREAMRDYIPREVYDRTDKIGQMSITPIEVKFKTEIERQFNDENFTYLNNNGIFLDQEKIKCLPTKTLFKYYTLARFIKIFG